jgi:cytochrome b involved in lipid metabolism
MKRTIIFLSSTLLLIICAIATLLSAGCQSGSAGSSTTMYSSSEYSTSQGTGTTDPFIISRSQVASHYQDEDCWVVLNGDVYDISGFLSLGLDNNRTVFDYCGRTDDFSAYISLGGSLARKSFEAVAIRKGTLTN